jgi:hypothetical protein
MLFPDYYYLRECETSIRLFPTLKEFDAPFPYFRQLFGQNSSGGSSSQSLAEALAQLTQFLATHKSSFSLLFPEVTIWGFFGEFVIWFALCWPALHTSAVFLLAASGG